MKSIILCFLIFVIGAMAMPLMFASDPRHEQLYYLHAGDVSANYSEEQLQAKELEFLKQHAKKLGYKLVKGK